VIHEGVKVGKKRVWKGAREEGIKGAIEEGMEKFDRPQINFSILCSVHCPRGAQYW
jgi:hypothetical protein